MPTKSHDAMIVGNWKMYKTLAEATEFIHGFKSSHEAYLSVAFTLIQPLSKIAPPNLIIGAQNMNDATEGAFTGEISARMLKDAGAKFVILGHSERRTFFKEDSAFIQKKVAKALTEGLSVILCVGETLDQKESGETKKILESEVVESLGNLSGDQLKNLTIAYEPIWAIGTGHACDAKEANSAHELIKSIVEKMAKTKVKVLYGGSVNPENAGSYLAQNNIDGLLIGGASLNVASFDKILSIV